jgi:hypothetical protein
LTFRRSNATGGSHIDRSDPVGSPAKAMPGLPDHTIIGHGQRLRQAHDDRHEHIWVRRGVCRPCGKTFTILPDWPAPAALFTLRRGDREQSGENQAASLWFGNRIAKLLRSVDPETNGILRVA